MDRRQAVISEIKLVTVGVTDLEGAVTFYRAAFGFEEKGRGDASGPGLENAWRMPPGLRGRFAVLGPPGRSTGLLAERLRGRDFEPDRNEQGNLTRQRWTHKRLENVRVDFLMAPAEEPLMADAEGSGAVRLELLRALRLHTVGPESGGPHPDEALPRVPSCWYLTRFRVPYEAPADQRQDEQGNEQLDLGGAMGASDDDDAPHPASARRASFPSSIGLSVLVPSGLFSSSARVD